MLVLTRKRAEMIQIGDDVVIKVIRTGKSTVKIGIEAPANVRVLRAELAEENPPAPKGLPVNRMLPDGPTLALACSDQHPHIA